LEATSGELFPELIIVMANSIMRLNFEKKSVRRLILGEKLLFAAVFQVIETILAKTWTTGSSKKNFGQLFLDNYCYHNVGKFRSADDVSAFGAFLVSKYRSAVALSIFGAFLVGKYRSADDVNTFGAILVAKIRSADDMT
jgi:hypothetical protein